jgi:cell division protein FtsL
MSETEQDDQLGEQITEVALDTTYITPEVITDNDFSKVYRQRYEQIGRLIFIYTFVKLRYQRYLNIVAILNSTLSSAITILTVLTAAITCDEIIAFNIAIACISVFITIMNTIVSIYDLNGKITRYQQYIDKANGLFSEMIGDLNVPGESKDQRKEFLIQTKNRYVNIIQSAPEVSPWLYSIGHNEFATNKNKFQTDLISPSSL